MGAVLSKTVVSTVLFHNYIASAMTAKDTETGMSRETDLKGHRSGMLNMSKKKKLSKLVKGKRRVVRMHIYTDKGGRHHVDLSLMEGRRAPNSNAVPVP